MMKLLTATILLALKIIFLKGVDEERIGQGFQWNCTKNEYRPDGRLLTGVKDLLQLIDTHIYTASYGAGI